MVRIAFHRRYDIGMFGVERFHPFDSRKYGRAWRALRKRLGREFSSLQLTVPRPISTNELARVHTEEYLAKLGESSYIAECLEMPLLAGLPAWLLDRAVLTPMRWAVMGTVVAGRAAMTDGLAVNLSGGYHHAKPDHGEGFCIYADVGVCVSLLRDDGALAELDRVAYIDLDAHQGNGVCHQFLNDPRVYLFDMFNRAVYPQDDPLARERIDCAVPLPPGCDGPTYLELLRSRLPGFLEGIGRTRPIRLAVYNAGSDVFAEDALGGLGLSAREVLERDLFVVRELERRGIPTVMVLSGGYSEKSYQLIADSVAAFHQQSGSRMASGDLAPLARPCVGPEATAS